MTQRRWLLLGAAALVTVLVVVTGALFLGPLKQGTAPSATPSPPPSTPQETAPPPWESTDLPGYDPDPGPFELTPLEETVGDSGGPRTRRECRGGRRRRGHAGAGPRP